MSENTEKLGWELLQALYELGRADQHATPQRLGSWLGVRAPDVQDLLGRLDAEGLVDAERCRLTMQGLVLAVSMHGAQKLARLLNAA
jgi:Mn-dependent DtxR family transcriptional regulator